MLCIAGDCAWTRVCSSGGQTGGEGAAAGSSCCLHRGQDHPPTSGWTRETSLSRPFLFQHTLERVSQMIGHSHLVNGEIIVDLQRTF